MLRLDSLTTNAEYIKLLMYGFYGLQIGCHAHWACPYVVKGKELGIITQDEITRDMIDKPVKLKDAVRWAVLTFETSARAPMEVKDEEITRFNDEGVAWESDFKVYMIKAIKLGIINEHKAVNAYEDGFTREYAADILAKLFEVAE